LIRPLSRGRRLGRRPLPSVRVHRPTMARLSIRRPSRERRSSARHVASKRQTVERRRARAVLLAAVLFAAIVLLSALPWSTLANQHAQLTSASAQVNELQAQNRILADQARELSSKATQAGLARQDYGLVEPGQKAYEILPASGTSSPTAHEAGHVPLNEPPVVPGSRRSEQLLGVDTVGSTSTNSTTRAPVGPGSAGRSPSAQGVTLTNALGERSFVSRVVHTLEFWN
jgi:cell division protein FtsB